MAYFSTLDTIVLSKIDQILNQLSQLMNLLSNVKDELYFYSLLTCTILCINKRLQVISNKQSITKKPELKDTTFYKESI